jgi:hypothetical protein
MYGEYMNTTHKKIPQAVLLAILLILPVLSTHSLQANPNDPRQPHHAAFFSNATYDLLIVAPKHFLRSLTPLQHHKNTLGVKTFLVDIQQVYDQMFWEGRDPAEKLKYFIKNAHEYWGISYVLLVGGRRDQSPRDTYWIPVRYTHLERPYGDFPEGKFLTDLYFADLYTANGSFSSWDTNHNGIYGEWPIDQAAIDIPDLYPDVYVGRLPCSTIWDVKIIVRKIITYETKTRMDPWFNTMVVVAGDTYPGRTPYYDGEVYTQMALDYMPDFTQKKLWTSNGSLSKPRDVIRAINDGCGFIFFSGHGNPKTWSTHPPDDETTWITGLHLKHMPFLINRKKLPVCIDGSGCFNSMFNISLRSTFSFIYGLPTPICWSWALTKKRNGGSIATIGSTGFSYESPDINTGYGGIEWLDIHFFEQYGQKNISILGEAWGKTIVSFLDNNPIDWNDASINGTALVAKNAKQWLLIGDPSLRIGGY